MTLDFLVGDVRRTTHHGDDDLLSAGLGLVGLAGLPAAFANPLDPTPKELRRRAIQTAWQGIADLSPLGGYGQIYGSVPNVPGREYSAFARLPGAHQPHRVLCQVPDHFDTEARCLVVGPSSGSRGIYGAAAVAGAWGLARQCAVVYTDKGTGAGYFDCAQGTGVALDGTRAEAGAEPLEFEPASAPADAGVAVKHAHSGDHPEADWGRHVLQAATFGLTMLDEAFPELAPFTPDNTRIIAVGASNGGAAVLQAAGLDHDGWLDGVVALEPNVHVAGFGRAMYDYATDAALWMPLALTHDCFADIPFARTAGVVHATWLARQASLDTLGLLPSGGSTTPAAAALEHLRASGWQDGALASAAMTSAFDLWRAVSATYASAYTRAKVGAMPGSFSFRPIEAPGVPAAGLRTAWWADGTGIPPHPGVGLFGGMDDSADPTLPGVLALRELWDGGNAQSDSLHQSVEALAPKLPRADLPIWVVHGAEDGLVPAAFSSDGYVEWLRQQGRAPRYWRLPRVQHFDAFLQLPDFGERYVPMLPYGYVTLDRMYSHVVDGVPLPDWPTPQPRPRGAGALERAHLNLPA